MAKTQQAANPFSKPKKEGDGNFTFKVPDTLGSGRGRIKAGPRIGRCTSIIKDTSKSSGNPMWTWEFVITKGPDAGRDFKLWTVLTDDAAWKIVETLRALGLDVSEGDEININKKDVIGVGCTMHIKDDTGKDGTGEYSKLDKISAHPEGAGFRPGGGIASKHKAEEGEDDSSEGNDEDEFMCVICDEGDATFDTEEELEEHMKDEHPDEEEDVPDEEEDEPPPPLARKGKAQASKQKAPPARGKAPATLGRNKR